MVIYMSPSCIHGRFECRTIQLNEGPEEGSADATDHSTLVRVSKALEILSNRWNRCVAVANDRVSKDGETCI